MKGILIEPGKGPVVTARARPPLDDDPADRAGDAEGARLTGIGDEHPAVDEQRERPDEHLVEHGAPVPLRVEREPWQLDRCGERHPSEHIS